jgi:hypothetical protein
MPAMEPQFLDLPAYSLVAVPIEQSRRNLSLSYTCLPKCHIFPYLFKNAIWRKWKPLRNITACIGDIYGNALNFGVRVMGLQLVIEHTRRSFFMLCFLLEQTASVV